MMTRGEAIKMLEYIKHIGNGESEYKNDAQAIAIDMAIKALSTETCDDVVNRQAVLDHIYGINGLEGLELSNVFEKHYADFIKSLPPVQPKPKMGHWIIVEELHGEWEGTKKYACNECGEKVGVFKSKYCPNCGADMRGEENAD